MGAAAGLITPIMNITIIPNIKINHNLPCMGLSLVWNVDILSLLCSTGVADLGKLHVEIPAHALLRPVIGNYDSGRDWRKDKNPLHAAMHCNSLREDDFLPCDSVTIAAFISTGGINTTFRRSAHDRPASIPPTFDAGSTVIITVILSRLFCALEKPARILSRMLFCRNVNDMFNYMNMKQSLSFHSPDFFFLFVIQMFRFWIPCSLH